MEQFKLRESDEFIKLGQVLKAAGLVENGVEAKEVIQNGLVAVNGEIDTRRGRKLYPGDTATFDGNEIKIYKRNNFDIRSINYIKKKENLTEKEVYKKYAKKIFQTAMPQSSIRPRVMEKILKIGIESELYSIEYVPKSGRNKGYCMNNFIKEIILDF